MAARSFRNCSGGHRPPTICNRDAAGGHRPPLQFYAEDFRGVFRRRKRKAFDKKPLAPHEQAERVLEAASQPVSTEAPDQSPDRWMRSIDETTPENSDFEQTMKDYYAQSDVEGQGGVPKEPPDDDPMPLQHLEKPKHPPAHNM